MDLHINGDNGSAYYYETYFDSFGVENIPKEIKKTNIKMKKKLKNTKISSQILIEYKHIIRSCVNTFVLVFLSLC